MDQMDRKLNRICIQLQEYHPWDYDDYILNVERTLKDISKEDIVSCQEIHNSGISYVIWYWST